MADASELPAGNNGSAFLSRLGFNTDGTNLGTNHGVSGCPCDSCAIQPTVDDELKESLGELTPWKRALVQMNVTYFGPALGITAYAGLWKSLNTNFWVPFPPQIWFILWFVSLITLTVTLSLYIMRTVLSPALLRRDFNCNRLVNFFFAPLIAVSGLALSTPTFMRSKMLLMVVFYALLAYQLILSLYVYGDWLFGKKYTLKWVSPTHQMAIIGNFLVAALGADLCEDAEPCITMVESSEMMFDIGALFWLVIIAALFLRLSSSFKASYEKPNPTLFLFVAPPAAAALSWTLLMKAKNVDMGMGEAAIDNVTSFFFFVDFYFYLLVLRISRSFHNQPFAVAFWAIIFPTSTAASASLTVAFNRKNMMWEVIATLMVAFATVAILYVAILTIVNLFRGKFVQDPAAVDTYAAAVLDYSAHSFGEGSSSAAWEAEHSDRRPGRHKHDRNRNDSSV